MGHLGGGREPTPGITWLLQPVRIFAPKIQGAVAQLKPVRAWSRGDFMAVTVHCPNPGAYVQCAAQAHVAASFSFLEQGHHTWVVPPVLRQILASRFIPKPSSVITWKDWGRKGLSAICTALVTPCHEQSSKRWCWDDLLSQEMLGNARRKMAEVAITTSNSKSLVLINYQHLLQVGKPQVEKGCRSERAGGAWGGEGLGWPRQGTGNGSWSPAAGGAEGGWRYSRVLEMQRQMLGTVIFSLVI